MHITLGSMKRNWKVFHSKQVSCMSVLPAFCAGQSSRVSTSFGQSPFPHSLWCRLPDEPHLFSQSYIYHISCLPASVDKTSTYQVLSFSLLPVFRMSFSIMFQCWFPLTTMDSALLFWLFLDMIKELLLYISWFPSIE